MEDGSIGISGDPYAVPLIPRPPANKKKCFFCDKASPQIAELASVLSWNACKVSEESLWTLGTAWWQSAVSDPQKRGGMSPTELKAEEIRAHFTEHCATDVPTLPIVRSIKNVDAMLKRLVDGQMCSHDPLTAETKLCAQSTRLYLHLLENRRKLTLELEETVKKLPKHDDGNLLPAHFNNF